MQWWLWLRDQWRLLSQPLSLGQRGEREAERFLRKLGYVIVATSTRSKLGEIDIVAVDGRTVVFVEVKTRSSLEAGHPAEAVDIHKQRRLTRAALGYIKRHQLQDSPARFDVIAITWAHPKQKPKLEHYRNAFEAVEL